MSQVFRSPLPDVELPNTALSSYVFRHADRLADRVAVVDGPTGRSYTYAELYGASRKAAGGLVAAGMAAGDVLALICPNIPEYAIVFHGVAIAGGAVTTLNPTYTVDEIGQQLRDSGARFLVTIELFLETARRAAANSSVETIFVLGEPVDGYATFFQLLAADPIDQVRIDPRQHVVVLPYSSGTMGLPKGVELTHFNLVSNLAQTAPLSMANEEDVVLAVLPFFHIYGMQVLMNGVLFHGARTVTLPRFDLAEFLSVIQEHRVTRVAAVPPIVVALAKHPMVDDYDLSSLVQIGSGAAPLSAEVELEAARRTGAEIIQGYGLTETSPATHTALPGVVRSGSIGVLVPNTEARLIDPESHEDVGPGESGELWIRGPQVMKGYLNNPEATRACLDEDGWFHTGDIGRVDSDDHWYITDRLKELIKYKGFQVAPAELEAVLLTHPDIADAAVISLPDEDAGEVPKAFVVLQPGTELSAEEVMEFVAGRVASFKKVRAVEFIEAIPKSLSGKILRRVLRDRGHG
ncbi:MAG TPA: 4-coumarate--CoA ligase family protein [Acidimicrobiia bacterium]|nr:4-coumarate--CoA ligase family protein [Acidimicrobiia bacterium]